MSTYLSGEGRACCSDSEKALFRGEKPEKIKRKRRFLWIYLKHYVKPRDRENVFIDEPMNRHTTFRIGGPADYFVTADQAEQVGRIIKLCREENVPYYIIGNGSNLLVGDKGIPGG